jgi:hypothetical protein
MPDHELSSSAVAAHINVADEGGVTAFQRKIKARDRRFSGRPLQVLFKPLKSDMDACGNRDNMALGTAQLHVEKLALSNHSRREGA